MKRAGVALLMVLFAMTMASALAVGGAYVARQLAVNARLAQRGDMLQPAAEGALVRAIAGWDSVSRSAQLVGTEAVLPVMTTDGVQTGVWVTRVSGRSYWIVAEAAGKTRPLLRRRMGVSVRVSGASAMVSVLGWVELP
jgi:hypothetical protein